MEHDEQIGPVDGPSRLDRGRVKAGFQASDDEELPTAADMAEDEDDGPAGGVTPPTRPRADRDASATRSQHLMYVLPQDWSAAMQILAPVLERADPDSDATQILVLTPDAQTAVLISAASVRIAGDRPIDIIPVTSVARSGRLLLSRHRRAVAGPPAALLELVRASQIKLDGVKSLVIAWADQILEENGGEALETLMAEIPRESDRVMVVHRPTKATDGLLERYLRRARRIDASSGDEGAAPITRLQYVSVSRTSRPAALRRLLDDLNPHTAALYIRSDDSELEARRTLRELGYARDSEEMVITKGAPPNEAELVILYDVPGSRQELRTAAGTGPATRRIVAFVEPRQMAGVRALAGESAVSALTLTGPATAARSREDRARDEITAILAEEVPARELLALEPLLEQHDGIEIAAAALRLLSRERERPARGTPESTAARTGRDGEWASLFVNIGSRDGATVNDLVGAITGHADFPADAVGKVEMRDAHSIVQVTAALASTIASRLTGSNIKNRRVIARIDTGRPAKIARPSGDRPSGDRPSGDRPSRDFGDRPRRDFGDRPKRDRGERPDRDRAGRPPRDFGPPRDRGDRPAGDRDRSPRGSYGGRDSGGGRGRPRPDRPRDDRPSRPRRDRTD